MTYIIAGPDEKGSGDLQRILEGDKTMTFQGYFTSLRAAEASARKATPDMAFIWLGSVALNAVRLAGALRERNPDAKIIFIGSHRENALEAFEYEADGFLLMPFSKEKIGLLLQTNIG